MLRRPVGAAFTPLLIVRPHANDLHDSFRFENLVDQSMLEVDAAQARFIRFSTRSLTTAGSASVEMSPRFAWSFSAIFLSIRRMILPERVFGRPGAH